MILLTIFILNISLLFVHEMDAIRCKEWKMFTLLKELREELGYTIFTVIHIPIYFFILLFLMTAFKEFSFKAYLITDIALIAHLLVHILFSRHKNNRFRGLFSRAIIYLTGVLAIVHLILLFLLK